VIVLPSRARPQRLQQFIDGYRATGATAPIWLRLDACDPYLDGYRDGPLRDLPATFDVHIGPRTKFVGACNELLERFPGAGYYGFMADDIVPRTPGWDAALIDAAGSDRVAWGNDLYQAPKCTHPIIGGDLMRAVGWFAAPGFLHWYIDTTWEHLANATGRGMYLPDIVTEHVHYERDSSLYDGTYHQRFHTAQGQRVGSGADERRWMEWLRDDAPGLVAMIREKFGAPVVEGASA
jgi:hypothetical protein